MNKEVARPLLLAEKHSVSLVFNNELEAHANVSETKDHFTIQINTVKCREMYEQSWLKDVITFEEFLAGIEYHEVAHIIFDSFSVRAPIRNSLFHYIHNVLLDGQIEYQLTMQYPDTAKYVRWILAGLRRDADMRKSLKGVEGGETINGWLHTLFFLTRFGVMAPNADLTFLSFIHPHVLSATRRSVKNVMTAARAIYEWIVTSSPNDATTLAMLNLEHGVVPIGQGDLEGIEGLLQVSQSNAMDVVKQAQQGLLSSTLSPGMLPGSGDTAIQMQETDTAFYRATMLKRGTEIRNMRTMFKRKLLEVRQISAFDGDLNFGRQQQAYMNSMIGEQGKDYHYYRTVQPSTDVLLYQDISSSTDSVAVEYAESIVVLLAAVQRLPGVRSALIQFNGSALTILDFDEDVRQARIFPRWEGGTNILPALSKAEKMRWNARTRIAIVITDGWIGNMQEYHAKMDHMHRTLHIRHALYDISGNGAQASGRDPRIIPTQFDTFHHDVARTIFNSLGGHTHV